MATIPNTLNPIDQLLLYYNQVNQCVSTQQKLDNSYVRFNELRGRISAKIQTASDDQQNLAAKKIFESTIKIMQGLDPSLVPTTSPISAEIIHLKSNLDFWVPPLMNLTPAEKLQRLNESQFRLSILGVLELLSQINFSAVIEGLEADNKAQDDTNRTLERLLD